jgi:hypothetical protein
MIHVHVEAARNTKNAADATKHILQECKPGAALKNENFSH